MDEYKASPSPCTDEEWEQILTSTFVDLKPAPDIEIRADVQSDGTSVTLSFRKNIQGITVRSLFPASGLTSGIKLLIHE